MSAAPKIAFLFLTYDGLAQETLWHQFFCRANPEHVAIHVHCKDAKSLRYFEAYKLNRLIDTEYATISIVEAQLELLRAALVDPLVHKCVFLSQSCIPLKSFRSIYRTLTADDNSQMNEGAGNVYYKNHPELRRYFATRELSKASQWCILSRRHAEVALAYASLLPAFDCIRSPHGAPDEWYFLSVFKRYAPDKLKLTPNLTSGASTFTHWQGMAYPFPYVVAPNTSSSHVVRRFADISSAELSYLLSEPCLFGRKFDAQCTVDHRQPLSVVLDRLLHPQLPNPTLPPHR